jgi:transcriptional regulator with XRE-family HTH domain
MAKAEFEGLGERVKELRSALGLSQRQFARKIFVSQTLVNEVEVGKRKLQLRILHLIAYQFKVNIEWLKQGAGGMFHAPPPDARLEHIIEIYHKLDRPLQDYLLSQSKEMLKIQKEMGETKKPCRGQLPNKLKIENA